MFARVNLAVMNLLPAARALDGGHVLLFLLVNGIAVALSKGNSVKYLNVINGIGFALLMALMLFVTFHGIVEARCEEDDLMSKQIVAGGVAIGGGAPV